jgi:endogenous inhibitor of DNA gyrase (YacG/DUF329 family)
MAPLQGPGGVEPGRVQARCALEVCGRTFTYDASELPSSFPFCSSRCKEVDLGMWVTEEYRVPASPALDEELSELDSERAPEPGEHEDQDD